MAMEPDLYLLKRKVQDAVSLIEKLYKQNQDLEEALLTLEKKNAQMHERLEEARIRVQHLLQNTTFLK